MQFQEGTERERERECEQGINFKTNGKVSIDTYIDIYVHVCSYMSCVLANSLSPCACHKVICNLLPSKPMRLDSVASCHIYLHIHTGYIGYTYICVCVDVCDTLE